MEKDLKGVFAKVSFGASGAPTILSAPTRGLQSVTRVSTGLYNFVFGTPASTQAATTDVYKKTLMVNHKSISPSAAPAAPALYIVSDTVATNGTLQVQFNAAGTATDPASGESAIFEFIFGDSNT